MEKKPEKPNIVFIMADDLGYGDLGCYGAVKIRTPNIDGVASRGMRFSDAHSSSAVCTPSRYSVLTGRYCWRSRLSHAVLGGFGAPLIEPERLTVASLLKRHGYATAAVGKWHLGLEWTRKDGRPLFSERELAAEADGIEGEHIDGFGVDYSRPIGGGPRSVGFDYFFGIAGSLDMPPYCFIEDDHTVGIPSLEKHPYEAQQRQGLMTEGWRDDLVDVTFAEKAVAFVRKHVRENPEAPFFLYLTPSAPHRPCLPPAFMKGKSEAGLRGDMVMVFDWVVGQVLETLGDLGIEQDTLLMITSDNGARLTDYNGKDYGHRSNGDLRGGKADIWDGGHREPLVARWPGKVQGGSMSDEPVCLGDLLATCADIVGEPLPRNAGEDSASLLPVLRGEQPKQPIHEAIVHHAYDGMFAVRKGDWKLIDGTGSGGFSEPRRYSPGPEDAKGQLYNLRADGRETLNLWKEQRREKVEELSDVLSRYRKEGRSA
jgi:arylsulfatase A